MKKQLYIIDGYNMIGAWPELVSLKKQGDLESARDLLIHHCANFRKFEHVEVCVATSDLAEQWVIFQKGALRKSAREFFKEIQRSKKKQEQLSRQYQEISRRRSPWSDEQMDKLNILRFKLQEKD